MPIAYEDSNHVHRVLGGVFACLALIVSGCGEPSQVDAVPRTSSNEPVMSSSNASQVEELPNALDFGFVLESHFACATANVERILANPELNEVPWNSLEQQLGKSIGANNARLGNMERIWIVVDRGSLSFMGQGPQQSPFIIVVDLKSAVDQADLAAAVAKSEAEAMQQTGDQGDDEEQQLSPSTAVKIGDCRIVMGSVSAVEQIANATGQVNSSLARRLKKLNFDSDVDGMVDIQPIRTTLQAMLGIMGRWGGEEAAKLARLPQVLQSVEFSISLTEQDFLKVVALIDDEKMVKELAVRLNDQTEGGDSILQKLPMGLGGFGGIPGQRNGRRQQFVMIEPNSTEVMAEVSKEISEMELFSVVGQEQQLIATLGRPTKLNELIKTSILDAKRQFELAQRVERLGQIADAMASYVDTHKCFPPVGMVNQSEDGLPAQFNWRIGLLTSLGEQELYDRFDFTQAWDSPENLAVASDIPEVFAEVEVEFLGDADQRIISNETRWHVVGGKLGLYRDDRQPKMSDVTDKPARSAVVVEGAKNTAVVWTEPGKFAADTVVLERFGVDSEGGILFANADFKVKIIQRDSEKLKSVLTPDGGEQLQLTDFIKSD
ncbi:MAG: hypothetical protein ACI87E_004914 [Mariniblastus sp.]|jgi:hypothetical protein